MGQYATKSIVPTRNMLILTVGGDATLRSLDILSRRAPLYETLKTVPLTVLVPDLYDMVDAAVPGTFLAFVGIDQNLDTVSVVQDKDREVPGIVEVARVERGVVETPAKVGVAVLVEAGLAVA